MDNSADISGDAQIVVDRYHHQQLLYLRGAERVGHRR
jgi:hypothetical protein